jgi:hypothetical protein
VNDDPSSFTDTNDRRSVGTQMADIKHSFGSCCQRLKEAIAKPEDDEEEGLEPLISVGEDGVLYLAIHLDASDPEELGTADHPVFFCPFCGTKLQTAEEVDAKIGSGGPAN